jgi:hypothetical protein
MITFILQVIYSIRVFFDICYANLEFDLSSAILSCTASFGQMYSKVENAKYFFVYGYQPRNKQPPHLYKSTF